MFQRDGFVFAGVGLHEELRASRPLASGVTTSRGQLGGPGAARDLRLCPADRPGCNCARTHTHTRTHAPARAHPRMRVPAAPPEAPPPFQTISPTSARVRAPLRCRALPSSPSGSQVPGAARFSPKPKVAFPASLPSGFSLRWLAACSIFIRLRLTSLSVRPPSLTEDGGLPQGLWPARPALVL